MGKGVHAVAYKLETIPLKSREKATSLWYLNPI